MGKANQIYRYVFNNFYFNPRNCGDIMLTQLGEAYFEPCSSQTVHEQPCFELTFIESGTGEIHTNGYSQKVKANDCHLCFKGENHKCLSKDNGILHFIYIAFNSQPNTKMERLINILQQRFADESNRVFSCEKLLPILLNLLHEMKSNGDFVDDMLNTLIYQLMITILRYTNKEDISSKSLSYTNKKSLAYKIEGYIDDNFLNIRNLRELENVFHYNYQYLSRCFNLELGIKLNQYFLSKKMEFANKLLDEDYSVQQISEKLNYTSIHAFSRAYTNYFSFPPSKKNNN